MKTVYGILIGIILILLVAFVYSPREDEAVVLSSPLSDSTNLASVQFSEVGHPEKELVAFPDPNPYIQQVVADYGYFIEQAVKKGMAPGAAVAIVRDTSIIFLKGFGLKQVGHADSVNVNTVFRLGSVSKCFASVLAGTLVSNQLINWDDPIIKYYPQFQLKSKEHTEKVTIRHVL